MADRDGSYLLRIIKHRREPFDDTQLMNFGDDFERASANFLIEMKKPENIEVILTALYDVW